jgi:hypothetical protein
LVFSSQFIPSVSEESIAWMLHFVQHDKLVDASLRNASFSMAVHLQDIKA